MKAVIEMPQGTKDKAELDKHTGELVVDRKLHIPIPENYGFVPNTLAEDGDPLDVFVLGPRLESLSELDTVPIGVLLCKDQGVPDHKIVARPWDYQAKSHAKAVVGIIDYLNSYKKGFEVLEFSSDIVLTMSVIKASRKKPQKALYSHSTLNWRQFVSLILLAGLLALASRLF